MSDLDERAKELQDKLKQKALQKVYDLMNKHSITVEDVQSYSPKTLKEKLDERRKAVQHKVKQAQSLAKAREVLKSKREAQ